MSESKLQGTIPDAYMLMGSRDLFIADVSVKLDRIQSELDGLRDWRELQQRGLADLAAVHESLAQAVKSVAQDVSSHAVLADVVRSLPIAELRVMLDEWNARAPALSKVFRLVEIDRNNDVFGTDLPHRLRTHEQATDRLGVRLTRLWWFNAAIIVALSALVLARSWPLPV